MPAQTAFGRATSIVVLHPKPLEDGRAAIVHLHGQGHVKFPQRPAQQFVQGGIQLEDTCRLVQLLLGDLKGIEDIFNNRLLYKS